MKINRYIFLAIAASLISTAAMAADLGEPVKSYSEPVQLADACSGKTYGEACRFTLDGVSFLRGVCRGLEGSQLKCGPLRGFDPSRGKADDPDKVWTREQLVERGAKVYGSVCVACHQADGKGRGNAKPLDGSQLVVDANSALVISLLLNGVPNAMPSWKDFTDADLAAVVTYIKNNWSNRTGQVVQPPEVKAARH